MNEMNEFFFLSSKKDQKNELKKKMSQEIFLIYLLNVFSYFIGIFEDVFDFISYMFYECTYLLSKRQYISMTNDGTNGWIKTNFTKKFGFDIELLQYHHIKIKTDDEHPTYKAPPTQVIIYFTEDENGPQTKLNFRNLNGTDYRNLFHVFSNE